MKIHGAESVELKSDLVSLSMTEFGGHLAPVEFTLGKRKVSPYAIAPWKPDGIDSELPVLLKNLRGDFLCFPFGPQADGPPHGETANGFWSVVSRAESKLSLEMEAADTKAKVTKKIELRDGETVVYVTHLIEGCEGSWSYGTHPILDFSGVEDGGGRVSTSPFRWASVYPSLFSDPVDGAQQALKVGAEFSDLKEVPLANGGTTDLTHYPARAGNDDLVMMINEPKSSEQPFAWSACLMDGYVWFSLKNPEDFPATLLWISNGGRSAKPWNSEHTKRLGIEEVCSHFCDDVEISRKNLLNEIGAQTSREFSKDETVSLPIIQGVAAVSEIFGMVKKIRPAGEGKIEISDESGEKVTVPVDWQQVC